VVLGKGKRRTKSGNDGEGEERAHGGTKKNEASGWKTLNAKKGVTKHGKKPLRNCGKKPTGPELPTAPRGNKTKGKHRTQVERGRRAKKKKEGVSTSSGKQPNWRKKGRQKQWAHQKKKKTEKRKFVKVGKEDERGGKGLNSKQTSKKQEKSGAGKGP